MKLPGDVAPFGLAIARAEPRWRLPVAVLVALGIHAPLWYWARRYQPPDRSSSALVVTRIDAAPSRPLSVKVEVDVDLPVARPRRPPPPSFETTKSRVSRHQSPPTTTAPAPTAAAGGPVARDPDPGGPVDLTGDTFVTGTAHASAGGSTTGGGSNAGDGATTSARAGGPRAAAGSDGAPADRSSRVSLDDQRWSCPWPREADAEQIDEQTVVIRVVVGTDGGADSVEIVSVSAADPGHGFARAAASCALRTRFTPARDRNGAPVRARSPPIRVRFTR